MLRGINVSGQKLIPMDKLQKAFVSAGFLNARTYIQSGNVVFQTKKTKPEQLEMMISNLIQQRFGFDVPVLVLDIAELREIALNNPFTRESTYDVKALHVTFLRAAPPAELIGSIPAESFLPDDFRVAGRAIYLRCPNGYGKTKLTNTFFEKKMEVAATTRNWNTVLALLSLAENKVQ